MRYHRFCPSMLDKEKYPHLQNVSKCWQSIDSKYEVLYDKVECYNDQLIDLQHLRISRIDNQPICDFMDMQIIKNDFFGEDTLAVEVYPPQTSLINNGNTYHLWTWKNIQVPDLSLMYNYD